MLFIVAPWLNLLPSLYTLVTPLKETFSIINMRKKFKMGVSSHTPEASQLHFQQKQTLEVSLLVDTWNQNLDT